jgi:hypothetical protein
MPKLIHPSPIKPKYPAPSAPTRANTSHLRPNGGEKNRKAPNLANYQKAKKTKELSDVEITANGHG